MSRKFALVTGASGIVGSGIVHTFLQHTEASVIAPVRHEQGKSELIEDLATLNIDYSSRLHILVAGNYAENEESMAEFAKSVKSITPSLDFLVSSFGGAFKMGTLTSLSAQDLHQALDRAIPHLFVAKHLAPLLKPSPDSSFTVITGYLGEVCRMPGMGALTVANATVFGLLRALEGEYRGSSPVHVVEMRVAAMIRKDKVEGHPFLKGGTAYPASVLGKVIVKELVSLQQTNENEAKEQPNIIRVFPGHLTMGVE